MCNSIKLLAFALFFLATFFTSTVYAGINRSMDEDEEVEYTIINGDIQFKENEITKENVRHAIMRYADEPLKPVAYLSPNVENLSKAYWATGVFNIADQHSIDSYLLVNECQIFNTYSRDDFEWEKITETTREYLKENAHKFNKRIFFIREIELGKYNFDAEAFRVLNEDLHTPSSRINVDIKNINEICGRRGTLIGYTPSINIDIGIPFEIEYLPVSPEAAKDFINRTNIEQLTSYGFNYNPAKESAYSRKVYLRMRVRLLRYTGLDTIAAGMVSSEFISTLEGYDVLEDQKGTRVMFTTLPENYGTDEGNQE